MFSTSIVVAVPVLVLAAIGLLARAGLKGGRLLGGLARRGSRGGASAPQGREEDA